MANTGSLLIRGGLLRVSQTLVQMIIAFFMMPMMIRCLGDHLYGIWAVVAGLTASYHLLDLGFGAAVTRFVAHHISSSEHEETNKVVSTALVIYLALALVLLLVTVGTALTSERFVDSAQDVPVIKAVVLIIGLSMALEFPFKAFAGIANAYLRYDLLVYSRVFFSVCSAFAYYWLLTHNFKLVALSTASLAISVASNLTFYQIAAHVHPPMRVRWRFVELRKVKTLFSYSIWAFLSNITNWLRGGSDNLVLAGFMSAATVTHYSVGQRLSDYSQQVQSQATNILTPLFTRYHALGHVDELHDKVVFMTKINALFACYCGWMLVLIGDAFIQRWIGAGYDDAYVVLCLLTAGGAANLTFNPLSNAMYAIAKLKRLALIDVVEATAKLGLGIALVRHYGVYGVAIATALTSTLLALSARPWVACRELQMPLRRHYGAVLPFAALTAVLIAVGHVLVKPHLAASYTIVTVVVVTSFPVYLWLCVNLLLNASERGLLREQVPPSLQPLARLFLLRWWEDRRT
jgi:O-antigen/teichoic acid export membrane protein